MHRLRVEPASTDHPALAALIVQHVRDARQAGCPADSDHTLDLEALRHPEIRLFAAWLGSDLAGCGALRLSSREWAEIKSMRTADGFLGRGVAAAILTCLFDVARAEGISVLKLETGTQPYFAPARALYRKFGFVPCDPFGPYVEDSNSMFMERRVR